MTKMEKAIYDLQEGKKEYDNNILESLNNFIQTELEFEDGSWIIKNIEYIQTPNGVIKQTLII